MRLRAKPLALIPEPQDVCAGVAACRGQDPGQHSFVVEPQFGWRRLPWPRSGRKKVARRETSGRSRTVRRALKTRVETFWRIFNAQILNGLIQTLHVWLPSGRRSAA